MLSKGTWIWLWSVLALVHVARAQAPAAGAPADGAQVAQLLVEHGFEDVSVAVAEDGWTVAYENRVYRYEVRGVQEVVRLVMPALAAGQRLVLVPRNRGIALASLTVPVEAYRALERGESTPAQFAEAVAVSLHPEALRRDALVASHANPSRFKVDVEVQPQLRTEFGKFSDPVQSQVNLAPRVSTSLWRGMRLAAQVIVPLQNDLDESESQVRPGLLTLTQALRPTPGTLVSATLGYFTTNQYGLDAAVQRYQLGGRLVLGARVGYTGYAAYDAGGWLYDDVDVLTYSGSVRVAVLPQHSFWLQVSYGQYVFQDRGWCVETERAFGEVHIGFYGLVTDGGENAGVRIAVPLGMRRYATRGPVRFRTAHQAAWQYDYRKLEQSGTRFETDEEIDTFWKGLTPAFVQTQLAELPGWP